METKLKKGAESFGIELTELQTSQLMQYMSLLREWNEKINLTAITEPEDIITKHFLDSMSVFATTYIKNGAKIIDVGTGAGFPGLVMKMTKPEIDLTLLDSLAKRLNFLQTVCEQTSVENVKFVHSRAEDGGQNPLYREKFDVAIARAVANMSTLSEYLLPFVRIGGYFIAMKGPLADDELKSAKRAIEVLGGEIAEVAEVNIPFTDLKHRIVVIKKVKATAKAYPRKAGTPSKKPL